MTGSKVGRREETGGDVDYTPTPFSEVGEDRAGDLHRSPDIGAKHPIKRLHVVLFERLRFACTRRC